MALLDQKQTVQTVARAREALDARVPAVDLGMLLTAT